MDFRLSLLGEFQAENAALAYLTLRRTRPEILLSHFKEGFLAATLPGRMEVRGTAPVIVLDGAHTPLAVTRLLDSFRTIFPGDAVLLFGSVSGKKPREMADILAPAFTRIIISTPGTFKESNPQEVAELFRSRNPATVLEKDPAKALRQALERIRGPHADPRHRILLHGRGGEEAAVSSTFLGGRLVVTTGDITRMKADVIVNAANSSLMGGGGVDGAIHRAGGPSILEACRSLRQSRLPEGLPAGDAVETTAGALPARWVIHTVGPVWHGGTRGRAADPCALLPKLPGACGAARRAEHRVSRDFHGGVRVPAGERRARRDGGDLLASGREPPAAHGDARLLTLRRTRSLPPQRPAPAHERPRSPACRPHPSTGRRSISFSPRFLSREASSRMSISPVTTGLCCISSGRDPRPCSSSPFRAPSPHAPDHREARQSRKAVPFASFLRAHIRGGRIESAEQVRAAADGSLSPEVRADADGGSAPASGTPGERIVRIVILHGGERQILWVRLWGAAANALLTDASGKILDAFYRRPKKGEISGSSFTPLPPARARVGEAGPQKEFSVRDLPGPGTFNERLARHFDDVESRGDVQKATAQADAELEISENKLLANIERLTQRLSEYANVERFRELGDLVTSNLHAIVKGERWLRVEDFFHSNAIVEIELKPGLAPAQNAEWYYDRHRKARLGRSKVEEEIEHLHATLKRIRAQRMALSETPDPDALGRVAEKAARARTPLREQSMPGLVFVSPPFRIIVGRTAAENDELLRKKVRGNDWWFHARDWPGAYVFVKAQPGKSLPLETMLDAATLAVHFSRGKTSGQGDVYYTMVKYLRRAKGAKKGTVLPTQEKNLHVKIDPARIERLKGGGVERGPTPVRSWRH